MTFGEKMKEARKEAGLSQEQLAEKLCVSRSAVAKWETDKGMPDVNNLKAMSQLLGVSVDYLLADDEQLSFNEMKEPISLDSFEKTGKCRSKKDAACYSKYSTADAIYPLIRYKKMTALSRVVDFFVRPGIHNALDQIENTDAYYLVETGSRQLIVRVGNDFISSSELAVKVKPERFEFGKYLFKKATYQLIER